MDKKKANTLKNGIIIVLGMHRSGTSALAGCITKLGVRPPSKLMPASEDNPKGYWEALDLMYIHDRLLKSADLEWSDVFEFPESWYQSDKANCFRSEIENFLSEQIHTNQPIVIKDPRICRMPKLWFDILSSKAIDARVVIPLRNPLEVADSLLSRNQMPIAVGCLLWLRYMLDAERASREMPRFFIRYEDLISNPKGVLTNIALELDFSWPSENWGAVQDFMEPSLKHHSVTLKDLETDKRLAGFISKTFQALELLADNPKEESAMKTLDAIQEEVKNCEQLFGPALIEKRELAHLLDKQLNESNHELKQIQQKLLQEQTEKQALKKSNEQINQKLDTARKERDGLKSHLREKDHKLSSQHSYIQELKKSNSELNHKVSNLSYLYLQAYKQLEPLKLKENNIASSRFSAIFSALEWLRNLGSTRRELKKLADLENVIAESGLFDSDWYLEKYKDVASSDSGIGALEHFIRFGLDELRDPGPDFSTDFYIFKNPDLIGSGLYPLEHYILYGKREGRQCKEG